MGFNGHKTHDPIGSTCASAVLRGNVWIPFTSVTLNNLDIYTADIRNAYLQALSLQKDHIICGLEFGLENMCKVALIHCALYGGKSAGYNCCNHLHACMQHLDFVSCPDDPDI